MQAAWYETFGPAAEVMQVSQQPVPEPGDGQVLIRLKTSGVNPSDVKKRAGAFPDLLDGGFVIPHSDGVGIIEAVGSGVPNSRIGERVWIYQAQHGQRFGTAADHVALDERRAILLPDNTGFDVGACLGIPAMTSHRCVFADGPVDGQTLLVTGGAGRVGHYAIQWAAQGGAQVIATASTPDDEQSCIKAGASRVVRHGDPDWSTTVLEATGDAPVDRVVDVQFGTNLPEVLNLIRTGGTIATYSSTQALKPTLPFPKIMYKDLTIRFVIVYDMPESAKIQAVADIDRKLRTDRLQHRTTHRLPLANIVRAHELIEQGGFRGCVTVDLD